MPLYNFVTIPRIADDLSYKILLSWLHSFAEIFVMDLKYTLNRGFNQPGYN